MSSETDSNLPYSDQAAFTATEVGDIFVESWGYDQTQCDYYQVVAKTKARVKVRRIAKEYVSNPGAPCTRSVPLRDEFIPNKMKETETLVKQIRSFGDSGRSFHCTSYSDAYIWNGEPQYETGHGWGH